MLHRFKGEEVVEVVMCMGVDIWNDVLQSPSLAHIALERLDAFFLPIFLFTVYNFSLIVRISGSLVLVLLILSAAFRATFARIQNKDRIRTCGPKKDSGAKSRG